MKATGFVRRVDDLGCVVIPKEIRRTMNIHEGDPMEIFTEGDMICIRRYHTEASAIDDLQRIVDSMTEIKYSEACQSEESSKFAQAMTALNVALNKLKDFEKCRE